MKIFKPKDVKKHSAPNICPTHEWQKNKPFFEQPILQRNIVIVVEIVDAHDGATLHVFEEALDEVGTDKAGRAGNENVHIGVE